MSRYSLHRPRRNRAVWDRPAPGTRILPKSSSFTVSPGTSLPGDGRSIDYMRQPLSKDLCRYGAPSSGRIGFAPLGDAQEHGVTLLPGAIAPLGAMAPRYGSTTRSNRSFPFGTPRHRAVVPSLSSVERCCRTDRPHTETPSNLARLLRHVWGFRRIAAGLEHPLRRTLGVGAGVVVFLFKSLGPSIASHLHPQQTKPQIESTPSPPSLVTPMLLKESGAEHSRPCRWAAHPVTDGTSACGGSAEAGAQSKGRARMRRAFFPYQSSRHELLIETIKKSSILAIPPARSIGPRAPCFHHFFDRHKW